MKLCKIFIAIILILLSMNSIVLAESANLVANPGFEENEGNDPYFWTKGSWQDNGQFSLDAAQAHSGKFSALITNSVETDSRYKQTIKVQPEKYYKLSCWVRTENVGDATKGANISIDGLTDTSTDIKSTSGEWVYVELYGLTGKNQDSFVMTLGLGGYSSLNSGKAWFDDVAVEELKGPPETGKIVNLFKEEDATDTGVQGKTGTGKAFILAGIFIVLLIAAAIYLLVRKSSKPSKLKGSKHFDSSLQVDLKAEKMKLDKKDYIIMAAMTLVYAIIALVNLGSLKAPETSWTPSGPGESIVLDLGRDVTLDRIYFYGGLNKECPNEGKFRIQFADSSGNYSHMATINKVIGEMYTWRVVTAAGITARYYKLIVDTPKATLNELAFFEKGSKTPFEGVRIIEKNVSLSDDGKVENLFDEVNTVDYKHTFMTGMIFDEIYHARTAYEFLHRMEPYEWTHPPLGKLMISAGIAIFGMNPFGWRISGTFIGILMVPIMYLFGRKVFGKKFYAFCAAFLFMFDFMHFGLTRIATIDVYGTFFIILMYYFMYDYFVNKSYVMGFRQSLKPLFLSGLCFGLGAASKWIGIYAGGGLAVLFFITKIREYFDYKKYAHKPKKPEWVRDFFRLYIGKTILVCIAAFVIIPIAIYTLSYIPFLNVEGGNHGLGYILQNQASMFKYHSKDVLNATHPFSSYWWQWPLITRPLETYLGSGLAPGMSSSMTIMGNPAIWWVGIFAIIAAAVIAISKRDRRMVVIFTAIAFQYLPWVGVTRIVFIYHFFSTVPFLILSIVYVIKALLEKYPEMNIFVYTYLGIVLLLFIMFYPVLSGMEVPRTYVDQFLLWFKGKWVF